MHIVWWIEPRVVTVGWFFGGSQGDYHVIIIIIMFNCHAAEWAILHKYQRTRDCESDTRCILMPNSNTGYGAIFVSILFGFRECNEWTELSHLLFDLVSLFTCSHFLQPEGATRNDVVREIDTKFCIHNICIKNCISHFCPMHDNMQVLPAGRIFFVSTIIICCYIWRYSYAND